MSRTKTSPLFLLLCLLAGAGFLVVPYLVFFVAPQDPEMGFSQKIFFFHVPCAWAMFLAAMMAAAGGVALLFFDRGWGDRLGAAAAELTVVFGVLVLTTGPLWARVAWGHFWQWDVRLTTVLILFLVFVGVLLARRYAGPSGARVAAGLALFGAADVPLVYISVKLWRTIHPQTSVVRTLPEGMRGAFFASLALFTVLFVLLLWIRLDLERSRRRLDALVVAEVEGAQPPATDRGAA
jgi:heme exporter protein C